MRKYKRILYTYLRPRKVKNKLRPHRPVTFRKKSFRKRLITHWGRKTRNDYPKIKHHKLVYPVPRRWRNILYRCCTINNCYPIYLEKLNPKTSEIEGNIYIIGYANDVALSVRFYYCLYKTYMLNRVFLVEINKLKPKRSKYKLINYQLDYLDYCLNNLLELHFFKSKINKDKKWQANYRESVVRTYLFRDLVLDGKLLDNESDIKKTKLRPYFTKKNGPLIHKRIVA